MASSPEVEATFAERVDFALGLVGVMTKTAFAYLQYPFLSASKVQPTLGHEITRSMLRRLLDRLNVAQIHYALPTTTAVYENWIATKAAKEDAPAQVVTELIGDDGAKLHWVGRKEAKKVILHFHGGGYILTMAEAHLEFNNRVRLEIKRRSGVEVKLAFLEYTLAPTSTYPAQFRQAVLALQKILDSGILPADIVITGDSAGGQLALQVVSHILHPHPSVPPMSVPTVPFAGIVCISPWVRFSSDAPSFVNNDKDVISAKPLTEWGNIIRQGTVLANDGAEPGGYWAEALKAPPEWWRDTWKVTSHVLITYGAWEGFLDDNVAFAHRFRESVTGTKLDVTTFEEPRGVHIGPFIDAYAGRPPSEHAEIITGWVCDRITAS